MPESSFAPDLELRIALLLDTVGEILAIAEAMAGRQDDAREPDTGTRLRVLSLRSRDIVIELAADLKAYIARHKAIREALAASECQFRSLAENLPDNIARWDCTGNYLYINPTHERTLLRPAVEMLGKRVPETHVDVLTAIAHVVATGEALPFVRQKVDDASGNPRIHEVSIIPERDAGGTIVSVLGIGRDVTEQAQTQEALAASERQFRTLAENLPNNLARHDPDARIIYLSPNLERRMGRRTEEVAGQTPEQAWPDGRYREFERWVRETARTGNENQMELITLGPDGRPGIHNIRFVPERDETDIVVSVLSISYDVTQQRRDDASLRMAASVFQVASEAIVIADPTGMVLSTNRAFSEISGYEFAEIEGRNIFQMKTASQRDLIANDIRTAVREHGTWKGEIDFPRKNGELFTARLSVAVVDGDNGEIAYYIGIFSDISQLKLHEAQLEYIAHHDVLTGLPNRMRLMALLHEAIEQARSNGRLLALLFIDLDGFKPVNDRLGHQVGDQTLRKMGERMAGCLRATDTVARIGGDEFVILLPDLDDDGACERCVSRLHSAIAEPFKVGDHLVFLSASIGIALYPGDADDADSLLRRADEAMYVAKRSGRSQHVFCRGNSHGEPRLDLSLSYGLRAALEHDQIEVHYQPIVDLSTGRIVKAEALARWRHPERGLVPPSEFIPVAESTGLIHAIGTRVFSRAINVAQIWNDLCPDGEIRRISVNRSPREFLDRDGVQSWIALLHQRGAHIGRMLSVEITEGLLLENCPRVLDQISQLRSAGMTIALDDFGTGFSSLTYLKKFAVDYLKIDRSFIANVIEDHSDRVIVGSVIAMARHLGLRLIAEGVETEAQAAFLASARCEYAQGYLYARPMSESEFLSFVVSAESALPAMPSERLWCK